MSLPSGSAAATALSITRFAELSATENELFESLCKKAGSEGYTPLYLVFDLALHDVSSRISELFERFKVISSPPLLKIKLWARSQKLQALSDAFTTKCALFKLSSPLDHPLLFSASDTDPFEALSAKNTYFFKDYELARSKIASSTFGNKEEILDLLSQACQIDAVYKKIIARRENIELLQRPSFEFLEGLTPISEPEFMSQMKFLAESTKFVFEHDFVYFESPFNDEILSLSLRTPEKNLDFLLHLENRLTVYAMANFRLQSLLRKDLEKAISGTLSYDEFLKGMGKKKDVEISHEMFISRLYLSILHLSSTALQAKDMIVKLQSLLIHEFPLESSVQRFGFDPTVKPHILDSVLFFQRAKEILLSFSIPEELKIKLGPAFEAKSDKLSKQFCSFLDCESFIENGNFLDRFFIFLDSVDHESLTLDKVITFNLHKEQLEQFLSTMLSFFENYNDFFQEIKAATSCKTFDAEAKSSCVSYLQNQHRFIKDCQKHGMNLFQAAQILFSDHYKPSEFLAPLFDEILEIDWSEIIKEERENEAALEATKEAAAVHPKPILKRSASGNVIESKKPKAAKIKNLCARKVLHILSELGFEAIRQKGSHLVLKRSCDKKTVIVPISSGTIAYGTISRIWEQAGYK